MTVTCIKKNTPLGGGRLTPQLARMKIAAYTDNQVFEGLRNHMSASWIRNEIKPSTLMYFRNWYRGMYNEGIERGLDVSEYSPVPPHRLST